MLNLGKYSLKTIHKNPDENWKCHREKNDWAIRNINKVKKKSQSGKIYLEWDLE
jgi:hypothetical protein